MKRIVLGLIIGVSLVAYFSLSIFIIPEVFTDKKLVTPQPTLTTEISNNEIILGQSFTVKIDSENMGDNADIIILSVAFPNFENINDENVKILSYNFTHSPLYIELSDEIGAKYTGGIETVFASYPSIEAYSRQVPTSTKYHMILEITPEEAGKFDVYSKAVGIPHLSELSHFPRKGNLDHQNEYVQINSVNVKP